MIFTEHNPDPPLGKIVESIFHYKDFMPDHSVERVVPTGHLFLIFELDSIPRHTYDNGTLEPIQTFEKVWISGMQTGCITISAHKQSEMFVIQFKPAGAHPILHIPISELNDKIVPAEQILGEEILILRETILSRQTTEEKFIIADEWLEERLNDASMPPDSLMTALQKLQMEPAFNLAGIIKEYPNTQKHLIHQFKKFAGLTPKIYQRILRFNEILRKIQRKENITWTDVAYQCGYSDQSHFIREFSHFSGFNPQEFLDQKLHRKEPNFFPLDPEG